MRAAIDLGTNSLRAIIVKDITEPLQILYEKGFIVRIGEGINNNSPLHPDAKRRTLDALSEIKTVFDQLGITDSDYRFVATSALRDAKDGEAFTDAVKAMGLNMTIISGIEEALIIAKAVNAFVPERKNHALFVDQGGGSVEFIHHQNDIETVISLDIGIVRLSERFFSALPPTEGAIKSFQRFLKTTVEAELSEMIAAKPQQFILIGGTGATLAKLFLSLTVFDSLKIHGQVIPKANIEKIFQALLPLSATDIAKCYALDAKRADVFTAGVLQKLNLMDVEGFDEVLICDRGLRYGLFLP